MTDATHSASLGDLLAGWADDVLNGRPPVRWAAGPGPLARFPLGPGLLAVLGGQPGAGKTAFANQLALDAVRLTTVDGAAVVDAAHIHRFADSGNNDPRNGLALCKNAHWRFDEGLWTLADDLTVEVAADAFVEAGPDGLRLAPYRGRRLAHLPHDPASWPDAVHLDWHRRNLFARE